MNRSHLRMLEAEAIFVLREVASEFERPVLLFSAGKDSVVVSHLARKAFYPGKIPFPLLHIDTGHNFPEVIAFREQRVKEIGERYVPSMKVDLVFRADRFGRGGDRTARFRRDDGQASRLVAARSVRAEPFQFN